MPKKTREPDEDEKKEEFDNEDEEIFDDLEDKDDE